MVSIGSTTRGNFQAELVNIDISEIDNGPEGLSPDDEDRRERKTRGGRSVVAFLAILLALAALAGSAWIWWQDRSSGLREQALQSEVSRLDRGNSELKQQVQALDDRVRSLSTGDREGQVSDLQKRLAATGKRLDELDSTLQEQSAITRSLQAASESEHSRLVAAEAALAELSRRELDAPGELDVAEVDYLLRLANERLTLFADTQAADRALALADSHLAAMDNPAYLVVRQEISAARRKLASVEAPDPVDVASRIDTLQEAIPGLPFRGGEALGSSPAEADGSSWWERLKSTLAGLVTIRRSTADENLELSLEDKDFVRQRLWMQLEAAHLALLRRDGDAFRDALDRARKTTATWFEPGSGAVQSFDKGLTGLAGTSLRADLPDISGPWSTLRMLRGGGAPQPPADAGGEAETPGGGAAAAGDGAG